LHQISHLPTKDLIASPAPPAVTATLIASQHLQPPQFIPLLFPPLLLFSTYLNLADFKADAAYTTAAWSGLYMVLARRRKQSLSQKWSVRGIVRGSTLGLCLVNVAAGGVMAYYNPKKSDRETK
jgi:hypothetical protein